MTTTFINFKDGLDAALGVTTNLDQVVFVHVNLHANDMTFSMSLVILLLVSLPLDITLEVVVPGI